MGRRLVPFVNQGHQLPVIALTTIVNTIKTSHIPANTDMTRATGFFTIHERKRKLPASLPSMLLEHPEASSDVSAVKARC